MQRLEAGEEGAKEEIAELFARWDRGDAELLALWRETRQEQRHLNADAARARRRLARRKGES